MQAIAQRPVLSRRAAVSVRAQASKPVMGLVAAAAASALLALPVQAIVLPSQESTGGMGVGKGSLPKSSTLATSEGYTLEGYPGTKKPSFIEAGQKQKLRAKARAQAIAGAAKSAPAVAAAPKK